MEPHKLQLVVGLSSSMNETEREELCALAEGCLAVCSPSLRDLSLAVRAVLEPPPPKLDVRPWFLQMGQLHSMEVESFRLPLQFLVSLGSLGSLGSLSIAANRPIVGSGVSLPPALTRLSLEVQHIEGACAKVGEAQLAFCPMYSRHATPLNLPCSCTTTHPGPCPHAAGAAQQHPQPACG